MILWETKWKVHNIYVYFFCNFQWIHSYLKIQFLKKFILNECTVLSSYQQWTLPTKVCLVKAMVCPAVIYGCESWTIKKAECWRIDAFELLEKTLESPLDRKEIKPVNSKGSQFWMFIGRTDAELETPTLWPPDAKRQLIGKDPDAGKDWKQ